MKRTPLGTWNADKYVYFVLLSNSTIDLVHTFEPKTENGQAKLVTDTTESETHILFPH